MRLRVAPSRSIVGIDELAVEPLRMPMSISDRFLEIAHLQALLHYGRTIGHKPGYHPVGAIPSQNPFQFRNRLRFHTGLVPKLTDRRSHRRDRANLHCRKLTIDVPPLDWPKWQHGPKWRRGDWYRYHLLNASKH